jgi:hypothetical protein
MLIVVWRPEDATKASLAKMGVHGEEVEGLPIPEDVREQADELGCQGGLAAIVNRSSGRVSFVGILGDPTCRKTQKVAVKGGEYGSWDNWDN